MRKLLWEAAASKGPWVATGTPPPSPLPWLMLLVPSAGLRPGPGRYCNQSHGQEKTPGRARAPGGGKAFRAEEDPGTELFGGLTSLPPKVPRATLQNELPSPKDS